MCIGNTSALCAFFLPGRIEKPTSIVVLPAQAIQAREPGKGHEMNKNITTFGELRNALPSTGNRRVPGYKQLREDKKTKLFMKKETDTGSIEIYDNGFYILEECGRSTVYGVDRCADMKTYDRFAKSKVTDEFDPYPWDLILASAASSRLDHNCESREESWSEISMDAPESENNPALSVRPEHERREEEEMLLIYKEERMQRMRSVYSELTEKQREAIILKRVEKLTQEEIAARMGLSRTAVRKHLAFAEKKIMNL